MAYSEEEKKWHRDYYRANPQRKEKIYASNQQRKLRLLQELSAHKLKTGCHECGFKGCARALEFHHNNGDKEFTISGSSNRSIKKIWEEVAKCDVLCANCHRMKHCESFEPARFRCSHCDTLEVNRRGILCSRCKVDARPTKIDWPPVQELIERVRVGSYKQVGRELGVSDNAIRKRIKSRS